MTPSSQVCRGAPTGDNSLVGLTRTCGVLIALLAAAMVKSFEVVYDF